MNISVNNRDLTYKAVAGLAGGALGWPAVELASHGHNLTDLMTTASVVATYATMAILSGLIGGFILASDEQKLELSPRVLNRFILGFVVCLAARDSGQLLLEYRLLQHPGLWRMGHRASGLDLLPDSGPGDLVDDDGHDAGRGRRYRGFFGSAVPRSSLADRINFPAINIIKGAAGGWIGGFAGGADLRPHQSRDRRRTRFATDRAEPHRTRDRIADRTRSGADQGGVVDGRGGTPER